MKTIRIFFSWSILLTTAMLLTFTACQKTADDETSNPADSELKKAPAAPKPPRVSQGDLYGNTTGNSIMVDVTISLDKGSPPVTECGVILGSHYFSKLEDPLCPDNHCGIIEFPPGTGTFPILLDDLIDDSVYFIRAYAINDIGIQYASVSEVVSITNGSTSTCGDSFTDVRDGQSYNVVQIGDQCWMAENLNYGEMVVGGTEMVDDEIIQKYCYNNNESNCETYGALYPWDEVMDYADPSKTNPSGVPGICPSGWHLPSFSELCQLTEAIDGQGNGGKLKEAGTQHWKGPNKGTANEYGFTALGSGTYWNNEGAFDNLKIAAYYWSTTRFYSPDKIHEPDIYNWTMGLFHSWGYSSYAYTKPNGVYSVRCVKNPN